MWVAVEWAGVFRSDDAGASWRSVHAEIPSAYDRDDPARQCFFQARDGGATWTRLHDDWMNTDGGHALALDPAYPHVIYMGTGNTTASTSYPGADNNRTYATKGVPYKSTDGGDSWEELPTSLLAGLKATNVFVDPTDPDHILLFTPRHGARRGGAGMSEAMGGAYSPASLSHGGPPRSRGGHEIRATHGRATNMQGEGR